MERVARLLGLIPCAVALTGCLLVGESRDYYTEHDYERVEVSVVLVEEFDAFASKERQWKSSKPLRIVRQDNDLTIQIMPTTHEKLNGLLPESCFLGEAANERLATAFAKLDDSFLSELDSLMREERDARHGKSVYVAPSAKVEAGLSRYGIASNLFTHDGAGLDTGHNYAIPVRAAFARWVIFVEPNRGIMVVSSVPAGFYGRKSLGLSESEWMDSGRYLTDLQSYSIYDRIMYPVFSESMVDTPYDTSVALDIWHVRPLGIDKRYTYD